MSNKYSIWTAALLAGLGGSAHAQPIPEQKSALVPSGKAQPAALTPATQPARITPAPLPPLVVLSSGGKAVAAPAPKPGTQAKLATVAAKAATPATVASTPTKKATQAKIAIVPAKVVAIQAKEVDAVAPIAPAPAVPAPQVKPQAMSVAAAGAVAARSGSATISEIAASQASALARAAAIKTTPLPAMPVMMAPMSSAQIVPELTAGQAIPILTTGSTKERTPPPPRPYVAAIIGLKGQELVEIQMGSDGAGYTLRAGDSIQNWSITRISDGRVHMATTEYSKKKRTSESKNKVIAVGDFL